MIQTYKLPTVTTTGSNGSATGSATSTQVINGLLVAVYVDYTTQPSTTDVTIATLGKGPAPAQTLLTVTDSNTDAWYYPRAALHSTAGAALLYASGGTAVTGYLPIDDHVTVSVAQGDSAKTVDVYLLVER